MFVKFSLNSHFISIHSLCEEGDPVSRGAVSCNNISIHSLCEEGDPCSAVQKRYNVISIHSLCEEGDAGRADIRLLVSGISIHSLCEEGDNVDCIVMHCHLYFNPLPL